MRSKLVESGLFEGLLDPFTPDQFMELRWGGDNVALFGNFIPCQSLKRRPKLTYESQDEDRLHCALFFAVRDFLSVDQIKTADDEVTPVEEVMEKLSDEVAGKAAEANKKQFVHWARINMKGHWDTTGEDMVEYLPPCPLRFEGFFRYFMVLCKQSSKIIDWKSQQIKKHSIKGRECFDLQTILKAHKLRPLAANLVRTSWDESSDEVRATVTET
uniref:Uncharacterized protein n=1 Tax=Eutreptiella gymnastica TaxID=73025 RepID=A0A7S4LFZ7_9EUGL